MRDIMYELKEKVEEALKATSIDDVYSAGMRNAFRYVISLIDGKEPQYEECEKSVESVKSMESPVIAKDLKNFLKDIPDETRIILCHELVGNEHNAEYVEYKDGAIKIHEARI